MFQEHKKIPNQSFSQAYSWNKGKLKLFLFQDCRPNIGNVCFCFCFLIYKFPKTFTPRQIKSIATINKEDFYDFKAMINTFELEIVLFYAYINNAQGLLTDSKQVSVLSGNCQWCINLQILLLNSVHGMIDNHKTIELRYIDWDNTRWPDASWEEAITAHEVILYTTSMNE